MMRRRSLLQSLMSMAAWLTAPRRSVAQATFGAGDRPRLLALASTVLPQEIGVDGQRTAVTQFLGWVTDYKAGAERDHGYGVTALRTMPPSPAASYVAQLDALDREAGGSFTTASVATRQKLVTAAITAAGVKDLPGRPNGGHIATDLMSHYFNSPAANDLAYKRAIGRDACRNLAGSDARPNPLPATERA
jgi:hypothetical protein